MMLHHIIGPFICRFLGLYASVVDPGLVLCARSIYALQEVQAVALMLCKIGLSFIEKLVALHLNHSNGKT